jgi:predicted adenylyl cyclase CyaB
MAPAEEVFSIAFRLSTRQVRKTRDLYLVDQTRIHCDHVDGLGEFLELEVVLRADQDEAEGQQIAHAIMRQLGVKEENLIAGAYMDLLLAN